MDPTQRKRLREFVEATKKRKAELESGHYTEFGKLNLVAVTGEYTFRVIDLLDELLSESEAA